MYLLNMHLFNKKWQICATLYFFCYYLNWQCSHAAAIIHTKVIIVLNYLHYLHFLVTSWIIDNMDLNIAHTHLSAFAIQTLDYVTDHTDVSQTPVWTFAPTNRTKRYMFNKKVEHWHLWGRECHFGFR